MFTSTQKRIFTETLVKHTEKLERLRQEEKKLYLQFAPDVPRVSVASEPPEPASSLATTEKQTATDALLVAKSSNGTMSITTEKPSAGLYAVLPRIRKTEFRPYSGQMCTDSEAFDQASKTLSLKTLGFNGSGTLIIIWDSYPASNMENAEYQKRPGGPVVFYTDETTSSKDIDEHGLECVSQAGGKLAGIAPGAGMCLVPFTLSPTTNLANIEKLLALLPKNYPVIIASSSALHWDHVDEMTTEERAGMYNFANELDSIIGRLRSEYPSVTFLFAAGNDSVDMCGTQTYSITNCASCFEWPCTNAQNKPYTMIGARDHDDVRTYYSNFGSCVVDYAYGGPTCLMGYSGFEAVNGTSFACPLAAGILALYNSVNLDVKSTELLSIARSQAFRFDETKITPGRQSAENQRLPDFLPEEVVSGGSSSELEKMMIAIMEYLNAINEYLSTQNGKITAVCALATLFFALIAWLRKKSLKKLKTSGEAQRSL